jgi:hypothetical protein
MELADFDLHNHEFIPKDIFTPKLSGFFKELEFFSLMQDDEIIKENWESV